MKCEGKIALVTGSTRGIGKATMYKLLEEGADVYMLVHDMKRGRMVAAATEGKYSGKVRGVIYFECDKLETIEASIKEAYEDAGELIFLLIMRLVELQRQRIILQSQRPVMRPVWD